VTTAAASTVGRMVRSKQLGDFALGVGGIGDGGPLTETTARGQKATITSASLGGTRYLDHWAFDGLQVDGLEEEVRTHNSISLTFRTGKDVANRALRPLNENPAKFDLLVYPNGRFEAFDRVDGSNTFSIQAPSPRDEVRYIETWHVKKYSEEVVDQKGDVLRVQLTLIPTKNKDIQASYSTKSRSTGEWKFSFQNGDILTKRVQSNLAKKSGSPTGDVLTTVLTAQEVRVLEENTGRQDAVRTREVPDGKDLPEDNTPNSDQTITLEPPNSEPVEPGEYIVKGWETTYLNDDFYRVSLTVTPISSSLLGGFGHNFGRYFGH